jgi:integrase
MGLNVTRKRKRDGTVIEYFYDRATGQFLGHDREAAIQCLPKNPVQSFQPGTIAKLVSEYRASTHYRTKLSAKTRKDYGFYLNLIVAQWGDLPVKGLKPGHIERIKSIYEATPRKANLLIAVFRIILSLAVKWEWIESNPAARPGLIPTQPRTAIWSTADEDRFLAASPASIRLAFALMLYTVQRPGDVLAMTKGHVTDRDGRLWLQLRQQKTDELVAVPVHFRLQPLLREYLASSSSLLLVPSPRGLPWAIRNFSRKWDIYARKAGLQGKQRRDLRRTGIAFPPDLIEPCILAGCPRGGGSLQSALGGIRSWSN